MNAKYIALTICATLSLVAVSHAGPIMWDNDRSAASLDFVDNDDPVRGKFYLAAFGGMNFPQGGNNLDPSRHTYGPGDTDFIQQSQLGWVVGIKAGYVWYTRLGLEPAVEIESFYGNVYYRGEKGSKRLTQESREWLADRGVEYPQFANGSELEARTGGDISSIHIMGNFILRAQMGRFRPYVGLGAGIAKVEQHGLWMKTDDGDTVVLPNDGGVVPAVQAIAGVEYLLGEDQNWGIFAEYKALSHIDQQNFATIYLQHLLVMGLRYYF